MIFRPDVDLLKNIFMLSLAGTDDESNVKSEVLNVANPQDKIYFVGVQLKEIFSLHETTEVEGHVKGLSPDNGGQFYADLVICLASRFPFFELHRKILHFISSRQKIVFPHFSFFGQIFNF